jgi:hypothetical protein
MLNVQCSMSMLAERCTLRIETELQRQCPGPSRESGRFQPRVLAKGPSRRTGGVPVVRRTPHETMPRSRHLL